MFKELPRALNSGFSADSDVGISQSGADGAEDKSEPIEHLCQVCPTCGHRLAGHRCKLICTQCGYYMSCADYY